MPVGAPSALSLPASYNRDMRAWLLLMLLADSSGPLHGGVELLRKIDPKHDAVVGDWRIEEGALVCRERRPAARIQIPYLPPAEYDLKLVVERTEGQDALVVGLASGDHQFVHVIDGYTVEGKCLSGFEVLDGKLARDNESARVGRFIENDRLVTVFYSVRKGRVAAWAGDRNVLDWRGDFARLSVREDYRVKNSGVLFLGAWQSRFRVTEIRLTPVRGKGIPLRNQ